MQSENRDDLVAHHDALRLCEEAKRLLSTFTLLRWEELTQDQKVRAGILGKWVCERLLIAFAAAAHKQVAPRATFEEIVSASGLPLSELHQFTLRTFANESLADGIGEDRGEILYQNALDSAVVLREIVIQNLFLLLP